MIQIPTWIKMLGNIIGGLILSDIGLVGIMFILTNEGSKLHFIWQIPLFIFGALIIYGGLRSTCLI